MKHIGIIIDTIQVFITHGFFGLIGRFSLYNNGLIFIVAFVTKIILPLNFE